MKKSRITGSLYLPKFVAEGQYFELCVKKYTRMLAQEMGGGE